MKESQIFRGGVRRNNTSIICENKRKKDTKGGEGKGKERNINRQQRANERA